MKQTGEKVMEKNVTNTGYDAVLFNSIEFFKSKIFGSVVYVANYSGQKCKDTTGIHCL